jgi:hypothetical protein
VWPEERSYAATEEYVIPSSGETLSTPGITAKIVRQLHNA